MNQNVNVPKRARFITFAISIMDNQCSFQKYKWITIKIWLLWFIINRAIWIKLEEHFWLFHQSLIKLTIFERLFWQFQGTRFIKKRQKWWSMRSCFSCDEVINVVLLHEKFLQFNWLRAVGFQLNLKYLHVKIK